DTAGFNRLDGAHREFRRFRAHYRNQAGGADPLKDFGLIHRFGVRRQSAAATALWIGSHSDRSLFIQSAVVVALCRRTPNHLATRAVPPFITFSTSASVAIVISPG